MIVSLRCVGVKSQKAFFIDAIFNFDGNANTQTISKEHNEIVANLMNCAVYNQTVADNTADILKASRHILSLGIITTVIALVLFFTINNDSQKNQIQSVNVKFSDSTFIESTKHKFDIQNSELEQINKSIKQLIIDNKENHIQLDSILQSIKSQHTTTLNPYSKKSARVLVAPSSQNDKRK